jgi:hypothetical protein
MLRTLVLLLSPRYPFIKRIVREYLLAGRFVSYLLFANKVVSIFSTVLAYLSQFCYTPI